MIKKEIGIVLCYCFAVCCVFSTAFIMYKHTQTIKIHNECIEQLTQQVMELEEFKKNQGVVNNNTLLVFKRVVETIGAINRR